MTLLENSHSQDASSTRMPRTITPGSTASGSLLASVDFLPQRTLARQAAAHPHLHRALLHQRTQASGMVNSSLWRSDFAKTRGTIQRGIIATTAFSAADTRKHSARKVGKAPVPDAFVQMCGVLARRSTSVLSMRLSTQQLWKERRGQAGLGSLEGIHH